MGSVKDLEIIKKAEKDKMGIGRFHFSDRYSVFDWGEMPDNIDGKGASLCIVSAFFFEKIERKGIKTHYRGVVDKNGNLRKFGEIERPVSTMEISLVRVLKPTFSSGKYDYSIYKKEKGNFLIPLEIIYRNGIPSGSSILKRLKNGELNLSDIGLDHFPVEGEKLEKPIFDISTKLEMKDRYISLKEGKEIACLSDEEVSQMQEVLFVINATISEEVKKIGIENEDGKIELGFTPEREFIVVDVIGTPDECRFTYNGINLSKEIARQYYRKTKWYEEVERAKNEAKDIGIDDWKSLCKLNPKKLPTKLKKTIENIYKSFANELTGKKFFASPPLKEIIQEYSSYLP
ncbi:MAG TPA: phosphoribosylaminoimidazolesuccinocarboxamide synthase [bacterium]|nr:phosphoribosylaminoimidazolesuccinocarboxamide synthase [bacterium]